MTKTPLQQLHHNIMQSIMTTTPVFGYESLHEKIIELCELISEENDVDWFDEQCDYYLSDLVVAAFWHYTEWHGGQYHETYKALSSLSLIYDPGMSCGCESDSSEEIIYNQLQELAENKKRDAA